MQPNQPREIGLLFCDETYSEHLNSSFRKISSPTDVLSFENYEDDSILNNKSNKKSLKSKPSYLGDIAICLPVAKKQAKEYEIELEEEIKRLVIHGILHLLGYDHEKSKIEAQKMQEKEAFLMKEVKNYPICQDSCKK